MQWRTVSLLTLALSAYLLTDSQGKVSSGSHQFLLQVYGEDQLLGFDIGCSFESTLRNSPMLGTDARVKGLQVIVNMFHSWAHNCLCQLKYHPAYRTGMGLEDLESLEHFFSSSNTIACTIRHSTNYHWCQAVDLHFWQWGDEKYQELST